MSELFPLILFYHPGKKSWYFYSKEHTAASHRHAFYWGVPPRLIHMHTVNDLQTPPGTMPMKAAVAIGNRAVIGPLIGILCAENQDGSVKGNFPNYQAIMETAQMIGGIVFAFTPSSVDWNKKIIQGDIFDRLNNKWVKCSFPFPNVVYNRIQDRAHENKKSSQACIQRFLSHPGLTLYNRSFFNKKGVISTLSKSPVLKKHIPETIVLTSKADLINMFKRHESLYLKPTHSRMGSGIIRVSKLQAQKPYIMQYYAHDKDLHYYRAHDIHQIWNKIRHEMVRCPYIIQQAVPLATVSACPFDCRLLIQKNHLGRWQVSGLGIRVAGHSRSITTHVPRGGRIATPASVLQQVFPHRKASRIEQRVHHLGLAIAKTMEKHHHPLGEMSADIGLDRRGYPWIFEANAKPMKFDEPEIRKNQLEQVIYYSQFLTFHQYDN